MKIAASSTLARTSAWEAWLSEVLERAASAESDAREIAHIIASAGDADAVDVPRFGRATRLRFPSVTVLAGEDKSAEHRITLPETSRWVVDHVKPWAPSRPWNPRLPAPGS